MKLVASAVLLGAASAVVPPSQHILKNTAQNQATDFWSNSVSSISETIKGVSGEVREIWDEVAMLFPDALERAITLSKPKPHTRRPDSHWDFITKGADVQSVWVENTDGEKEREIEGRLEPYNLRTRKVDPSKLGIDPGVKQYSGYLDDNENDKHLFYCMYPRHQTGR